MVPPNIKLTFVSPEGDHTEIAGPAGHTVMKVASDNGIEGIAAECGGSMSCGTCHVYLDAAAFERIEAPNEAERDMLDLVASARQPTSRLSCQVVLGEALDGAVVTIPEQQF
ncbi:MAG TPA: 2Fe-2S iron-sulfur cluster-binding protein [Novosphingobium sp.]|nr:2Fe-2S iron-sulfur cluster-binding protein [Novosphingobium sp.]